MLRRAMMAANSGGGGVDPHWANVVSLLHFDGVDGSTTFTDQKGKSWTPAGSAQLDNAQVKFGSASGLFPGSSLIQTAAHSDWELEDGDFTLEMWFRATSIGTRMFLCGQSNGGASTVRNLLEITASGKLRYLTGASPSFVEVVGSTTLSTGTWYHLAATKSGTTRRVFVDGVLDGSATNAAAILPNSGVFCIGRAGSYSGLTANGHIDDFRATKGVARYTSSFTPPTEAFPDG